MIEVETTAAFRTWLRKLRDAEARVRIVRRISRIEMREQYGDHKGLGSGLVEMRVDYGPGYRIYLTHLGDRVILLVAGGDKSTQSRDIAAARKEIKRARRIKK